MQVTCYRCGSTVEITPISPQCEQCGADLVSLLTPEAHTEAHYRQAVKLALAGNHLAALEAVQQGLAIADSSDLHLLAALIHQKEGQFDQMRRHVAAIPADDVLRREGEWLLRSHQEKQSLLRQRQKRAASQSGEESEQAAPPATASEFEHFPAPDARIPQRRRRSFGWLGTIAVLVLLAALIWWRGPETLLADGQDLVAQTQSLIAFWVGPATPQPPVAIEPSPEEPVTSNTGGAVATDQAQTTPTAELQVAKPADAPATPTATTGAAAEASPTSVQAVQSAPVVSEEGSTAQPGASIPAPTATSTAIPTSTPFMDMVAAPSPDEAQAVVGATDTAAETPTAEPVASGDLAEAIAVLATVESEEIALPEFLAGAGREDLAALPIHAVRTGELLTLEGTVDFTQQREEVIALAAEIPGVERVQAIDLHVRLPATYIVQEGDTLWYIAQKLYGEGERWTDLYEANRALLGNSSLLTPGLELTVPPM